MKFVMSYSCGKDSTLALHKMIEDGNEPVALLVMVNEAEERSFFHGADCGMLEKYSAALGLPLLLTPTKGEHYHIAMEDSLRKAKEMGAEAACFGDIDIESNRAWSEERCANAGIEAVFPLWHRDRAENVYEMVELGYKCLIKSVNNTLLPASLLGKIMDKGIIEEMKQCGIDICGENGEYHTLVADGPVFKNPIPYVTGEILDFGDYSVVDVIATNWSKNKMETVKYIEKFGKKNFPDGFEAMIKDLTIQEQMEYFRTTSSSTYGNTEWTSRTNGYGYRRLEEDDDVKALIVKDNLIVGVMIKDEFGHAAPCFPEHKICTYYAEENNGAGYKTRADYTWLVCVPYEFRF